MPSRPHRSAESSPPSLIVRSILFSLPLVCAVLFLGPSIAGAGYDRWTAEDGPFGGRIETLYRGPEGTCDLFAGTEGGGLFRRENGAWVRRNNGLLLLDVLAFAARPGAPDSIYAGTGGGGVYRSANGGESWFPVNGGLGNLTVRDLRFRSDGVRLFAATAGGGIYYTDDAGAVWTPANSGLTDLSIRALADARSASSVWYAGTGEGVFRSADGCDTWAERSSGLDSSAVADLAVHPGSEDLVYAGTYGSGVYRTVDGGANWVPRRTGMGEVYVEEIRIDEERPETLWAATRTGLFESFDGGGSWNLRNEGLADTATLAVLLVGDTLFAGSYWGGVHAAPAAAGPWTDANEGLANRFVWEIAPSPNDRSVYWASSYGALHVSTDTGWTWTEHSSGIVSPDLRTVAVSPDSDDQLLAGAFYGGVYRSLDGGAFWFPSSAGLPASPTVTALRYRRDNGALVLCGTYSGIYRSGDGGSSWVPSQTGFGAKKVWGLASASSAPNLVYAGTYENGLFHSHNFGATWDSVPLPDQFVRAVAVHPADTAIVYAGGYYVQNGRGGVYKTDDGGSTWTRRNDGLGNWSVWSLAINPDDPEHLLVGTAGGIYESWNGAASWSALPDGLEPADTRSVLFAADRYLAGTYGGSAPWYEKAIVSVGEPDPGLPAAPSMLTASPNPFNPSVTFLYRGPPDAGPVRLTLHDLRGRTMGLLF